jgi:hypothetical protein
MSPASNTESTLPVASNSGILIKSKRTPMQEIEQCSSPGVAHARHEAVKYMAVGAVAQVVHQACNAQ